MAKVKPGRGGGGSDFNRPDPKTQFEKVARAVSSLETELQRKRTALSSDVKGTEPSAVLVLEIAGELVEDFFLAAKKINLEWLGELDIEDAPVVEGFEELDDDGNAKSNGRTTRKLFLTMADKRGLNIFLGMWRIFNSKPKDWPPGTAKWRDVFSLLTDVRFWSTEDRLRTTGVLEIWREQLKYNKSQDIRCSIELWFRKAPANRISAEAMVRERVEMSGGTVVGNPITIPEIQYHALEVSLQRSDVEKVLAGKVSEIALLQTDEIMLFNGCGQGYAAPQRELAKKDIEWPESGELGKPIVALLDGVPVQNHKALEGRIEVDDVNDLEPRTLVADRAHGTSMASLIAHGDCNAKNLPIGSKILACPILVSSTHDNTVEVFPSERNHLEVVKSTVEHVVANHPQIRVFNLSVGDEGRPFLHSVSPFARLLDWLSYKYNVLFIVSAGNVGNTFKLDISRGELKKRDAKTVREAALRAIRDNAHNNRLLSPAESINSLTVGALSSDYSKVESLPDGHYELLGNPGRPAMYTAVGSGYRGAVKPDLMLPGGKMLYRDFQRFGDADEKPVVEQLPLIRAPGQLVAFPDSLTVASYSRGTSNSAALASRLAVQLHQELTDIRGELDHDDSIHDDEYTAVILKALLLHSNRWRCRGYEQMQEVIGDSVSSRKQKSEAARFLGVGEPSVKRLINESKRKATVLGVGTLTPNQAHSFIFPFPPELSEKNWGKLIFTQAYFSPIKPSRQKYRGALLELDFSKNGMTLKEEADGLGIKPVGAYTVQHAVRKGTSAPVVTEGDSLTVRVSCRPDALNNTTYDPSDYPIKYAVVATLEAKQQIDVQTYVRSKIRPRVRIDQRN